MSPCTIEARFDCLNVLRGHPHRDPLQQKDQGQYKVNQRLPSVNSLDDILHHKSKEKN